MKKKLIQVPLGNKAKKKKIFKSIFFRFTWNRLGRLKKIIDCFGCGDSLWWKEDVSMAFTKPERSDELPFGSYSSEIENKIQETKPEEPIFLGWKFGVNLCKECFINKSEQELLEIFETVAKPLWMKGQTLEQMEKIRNYKLYLPIRTTGGTFKKEMVESNGKSTYSFSPKKLLRKLNSIFTRGSLKTSVR